jgi:hypothetical protein
MCKNATEALSEDRFWEIIERSLDGTGSAGLTMDWQTQSIEQELQQLSYDEFVDFLRYFRIHYGNAYRNDLWAVAYVVMGGCSDDCFMDFRTWLVTRGRSVYFAALRDPDSLCSEFDKLPDGEIPLWEYYFEGQFDARFGDAESDKVYELHNFAEFAASQPLDPENKWMSSDEDSIKKQCPLVFEKWWNNDRF